MKEQEERVVTHLAQILQDQKPLSDIHHVLAPQVIAHMDNYSFKMGHRGWIRWVQFLREQGQVSNPSGIRDDIRENPDGTWTLLGHWTGERQGKQVMSEPSSVTYRFEEGKIVEIWSKRTNYTLFFPLIRYRVGLALVFLYLFFWDRFLRKVPEPVQSYS